MIPIVLKMVPRNEKRAEKGRMAHRQGSDQQHAGHPVYDGRFRLFLWGFDELAQMAVKALIALAG
jgi:hypothetical protein